MAGATWGRRAYWCLPAAARPRGESPASRATSPSQLWRGRGAGLREGAAACSRARSPAGQEWLGSSAAADRLPAST
jgi:hypothetical protein